MVVGGALLLQACGLPSNLPTLGAPTSSGTASSNNVFSFNNGVQFTPNDLYGFEIYYKFYDDSTGNGGTQYYTDNTQLSTTATGPSQLLSLGYRRAYLLRPGYAEGNSITQPETPLIPIADASLKSTTFPVTIDFTPAFTSGTTNNFYPKVVLNGSPIMVGSGSNTGYVELARYFAIPDTPFSPGNYILQGFGNNDFANDQGTDNGQTPVGDIPSSITDLKNIITPQALVLGFYAIAYGLFDFTTPIYSTPTALGYIQYNSVTFTLKSDPQPTQ